MAILRSFHRDWRLPLIVSALGGFLASGCVSAQVEFEDVRVTKQNLQFPGATEMAEQLRAGLPDASSELSNVGDAELGTRLADAELPESLAYSQSRIDVNGVYALPPQRFSYASGAESIPSELAASFELHEIVVQSHAEGRPLAFIQRLLLTRSDSNLAEGHPQVVFDYDRDSEPNNGTSAIHIPVQGNARLLDRAALANSNYELVVWANLNELPQYTWSVDVSLTLSGQVSVKY